MYGKWIWRGETERCDLERAWLNGSEDENADPRGWARKKVPDDFNDYQSEPKSDLLNLCPMKSANFVVH